MARYLTTDQIAAAIFRGRSEAAYRLRLAQLAHGDPELNAYIRSRPWMDDEGRRQMVWTPTTLGYTVAARTLGVAWQRVPDRDVNAALLQHDIELNQVLLELLVVPSDEKHPPPPPLPSWRWLHGESLMLPFENRSGSEWAATSRERGCRLQPDALVDAPRSARRVFIEYDRATTGVFARRATSIYGKLERFGSFADPSVIGKLGYAHLFPDGIRPTLLFVAHNSTRATAISGAISKWQRDDRLLAANFDVDVTLLDGAGAYLRGIVGSQVPNPEPSATRTGARNAVLPVPPPRPSPEAVLRDYVRLFDGLRSLARQVTTAKDGSTSGPNRSEILQAALETPEALPLDEVLFEARDGRLLALARALHELRAVAVSIGRSVKVSRLDLMRAEIRLP
jgi:hypothetical protein